MYKKSYKREYYSSKNTYIHTNLKLRNIEK